MKKRYLFLSLFSVVIMASAVWAVTWLQYFDFGAGGIWDGHTEGATYLNSGGYYDLDLEQNMDATTTVTLTRASDNYSVFADNPVNSDFSIVFDVPTSGYYYFVVSNTNNQAGRVTLYKE